MLNNKFFQLPSSVPLEINPHHCDRPGEIETKGKIKSEYSRIKVYACILRLAQRHTLATEAQHFSFAIIPHSGWDHRPYL